MGHTDPGEGGQGSCAACRGKDRGPTLNTHPDYKATSLCHPDELRPLSVSEYARIQGFPDDWVVEGSLRSKYRQLGNAVPVTLGELLGREVIRASKRRRRTELLGRVECHDLELLDRLSARPRTRLNHRG